MAKKLEGKKKKKHTQEILNSNVTNTYLLFSMGKKLLVQTHFTPHRIKHCYLLMKIVFAWEDPFWYLHGQRQHLQSLVEILAVAPDLDERSAIRTLYLLLPGAQTCSSGGTRPGHSKFGADFGDLATHSWSSQTTPWSTQPRWAGCCLSKPGTREKEGSTAIQTYMDVSW